MEHVLDLYAETPDPTVKRVVVMFLPPDSCAIDDALLFMGRSSTMDAIARMLTRYGSFVATATKACLANRSLCLA